MQRAWTQIRREASNNYGIEGDEGSDDWHIMGSLAETTPTLARNRGAAEKKSKKEPRPTTVETKGQPGENQNDHDQQREREQSEDMADMMAAMEDEREL